MTDTTSSKKFLRALQGETFDVPPIWLMRQAGRYLPEYREVRADAGSFLNLCYNPELACEVTMQPIRRYGFDAAILFSDILVVPDALGQLVEFVEGEGPKLEPVRQPSDVAKLSTSWIDQRLAPVYETVSRIKAELPSSTALIGFAGAPWTIATYMVEGGSSRDFAITKRWALGNRETFAELIDLIVEGTIEYLSEQVAAGADALQLFDTWASAVPYDRLQDLVIDPTRRIIEGVRAKHPGVPFIGFARGIGAALEDYVAGTGINAVGLDSTVPVKWAAKTLQGRVTLQGNLDPQYLLVGGDSMKSAAIDILENLSGGPFVFNLGHGIIKETRPEEVEALVETVRQYGK